MLKINAFNGVVAGILLQLYLDGEWYSIAFFFKKIMDLAKCNYKVYNKKILTII